MLVCFVERQSAESGFLEAKAGQSVEIQLNGQLPDWPSTAGAPVFFKISIPPKRWFGSVLFWQLTYPKVCLKDYEPINHQAYTPEI